MQESLKSSGMTKKLKPYSLEKSYLLLKKEKKRNYFNMSSLLF